MLIWPWYWVKILPIRVVIDPWVWQRNSRCLYQSLLLNQIHIGDIKTGNLQLVTYVSESHEIFRSFQKAQCLSQKYNDVCVDWWQNWLNSEINTVRTCEDRTNWSCARDWNRCRSYFLQLQKTTLKIVLNNIRHSKSLLLLWIPSWTPMCFYGWVMSPTD